MRSLLYGILGLVVGSVFCISLLTGMPQNVTRTTQTVSSQKPQQQEKPQDPGQGQVINNPNPNQNIVTYRVNANKVEQYKSEKVVEYGRSNPMLYYKKEVTQPVDPTKPQTPNTGKGDKDIPDGVDKVEDPTDIIDENTDEVDKDVDKSVVEFNWASYESSYVLPRGYLFGYNTDTKKLNIVDVASLEGDILTYGKFPVDKKYYGTSSNFGIRTSPIDKVTKEFHKGLDIAAAGIDGANVYAILDGTITQASDNDGYGNYVIVDHGKYSTIYAHLSKNAENLKTGDKVKAGDIIGYVGSTGRSTGPHLHLEFDIDGVKLTPKHFLNLMSAR